MKRSLLAGLAAGILLVGMLRLAWQPRSPDVAPIATPAATRPSPNPSSPRTAPALATAGTVPAKSVPLRPPVSTGAIAKAATPFEIFSDWTERYWSRDPQVSLAVGEALAWKRREAMRELIQTDPARALELAAPFRWRQELPAAITRHFEEAVDARGDLEVALALRTSGSAPGVYRRVTIGDRQFDAFVYGRRLAPRSQARIPLHGIALDGK